MEFLKELRKNYVRYCEEVAETGSKLGDCLCKKIRKVIPDLQWSLGWEEAGIDTICFWSDSHDISNFQDISLDEVIEKIFPELSCYVDCPFGVFLTKDEAKLIKNLFKES